MPWAPLQTCRTTGCRNRQAGPRCALHERVSARNHRGIPRQRRGLGADADRARREVAGGPCVLRFPGCTGVATTLEHTVPRSKGGTLDDGYGGACAHCQAVQGGRLAAELRR